LKVLFLPGLDGTGLLFNDVINALPDNIDIEIISLNQTQGATNQDQAKQIAKRFAQFELFIVAESYSGRIAYELCNILEGNVIGIVFIASFISRPSFTSKFATFFPTPLLKPNFINNWLIQKVGFSGQTDYELANQVFKSLANADPMKLKERLRNISELKDPQKTHIVPVTYIRPTRDYLVSNNAVDEVNLAFKNMNTISISGGHFIAQSRAEECAKIIEHAVSNTH
jgi:surfactin synthase thioesterase subunit